MMADLTRTCGYCCSRRPLAELGQVGTGFQCLDYGACQQRAADAMIYPVTEYELEQALAAREAMAGAVPPRAASAEPAPAPQPEAAKPETGPPASRRRRAPGPKAKAA
jgi:hypothetical protein